MKQIIVKSFSLFAFLLIISCENNSNKNEIDGVLIHSVYFWLNNPGNETERQEFEIAVKKLLNTNKLAVKKHLGKPGNTEKREVVDNSYDYCMILGLLPCDYLLIISCLSYDYLMVSYDCLWVSYDHVMAISGLSYDYLMVSYDCL